MNALKRTKPVSNYSLPSVYSVAKNIDLVEKKYNGYPYLIQALLSAVPELRSFPDEDVIEYHHSIRRLLALKLKSGLVPY